MNIQRQSAAGLLLLAFLAGGVTGQSSPPTRADSGVNSAALSSAALNGPSVNSAVVIFIDAEQHIRAEDTSLPPSPEVLARHGLLIWAEDDRDRWIALPADALPTTDGSSVPRNGQLAGVSRGDSVVGPQGLAMLTPPLDQLVGGELLRAAAAGGFLTPVHEQQHLSGRLTLRRLPRLDEPPFPRGELTLRGAGGLSAKLVFPEGQSELSWSAIEGLPDAWAQGLPPGTYLLRDMQGEHAVRFAVAASEKRTSVMRHAEAIEHLLGTRQHPLYVQMAVESLLPDESLSQERYPADVLDLLDAAEDVALTAYLKQLHEQLLAKLRGEPPALATTAGGTGIEEIDLARRQIELGRWTAARETLAQITDDAPARTRALADLYLAVILAESGPATADEAFAMFVAAIEGLPEDDQESRYRAHNNFANFLLTQAQDALYNNATRAASQAPLPLLTGLRDWQLARDELERTSALSEQLDPRESAAVQANLARLYSLLADFVFVLNSGVAESQRFLEGEQLANTHAAEYARAVVNADPSQVDGATLAVAHEILARLAHRGGERATCREHAEAALHQHLQRGALAGAESVHRILAMSLLREAEDLVGSPSEMAARKQQAQKHLSISSTLSEFLRTRFPLDAFGLSRAGFFARRAYVNDNLVGLLVAAGNAREALRHAELAKARALQDFLATNGAAARGMGDVADAAEAIPAPWPEGMVALEYFLGAEKVYVFVIDASGVQAEALVDSAGELLTAQRLIAEVRALLTGVDHTAKKLSSCISTGRPIDRRWHEQLHWLYQRLIPPAVAQRIAGAETLLVVPHHVLHYVPFAALITEPDRTELKSYEIPQPRYLIESVGCIVHAPSLSAFWHLRQRSATPLQKVNGFGRSTFAGLPALPGVENDLRTLKRILGKRVGEIAEGDGTHEEDLLALLAEPGALLVGTHGLNLPQAPLMSYLRCGSGADGDGLLQAAELYTAPIHAGLVILSACYSGLADQTPLPGDDLFGLQRALLQSGSATVVAGHWDVFDRTGTLLMEKFLTQLATGKPVAQALADAQREFFVAERDKRGVYSHPYFWAVLSVAGSDQSRLVGE